MMALRSALPKLLAARPMAFKQGALQISTRRSIHRFTNSRQIGSLSSIPKADTHYIESNATGSLNLTGSTVTATSSTTNQSPLFMPHNPPPAPIAIASEDDAHLPEESFVEDSPLLDPPCPVAHASFLPNLAYDLRAIGMHLTAQGSACLTSAFNHARPFFTGDDEEDLEVLVRYVNNWIITEAEAGHVHNIADFGLDLEVEIVGMARESRTLGPLLRQGSAARASTAEGRSLAPIFKLLDRIVCWGLADWTRDDPY